MKDFFTGRIRKLESKIVIQKAILDELELGLEPAVDLYCFRKLTETRLAIKQLHLLKKQAESDMQHLSLAQ